MCEKKRVSTPKTTEKSVYLSGKKESNQSCIELEFALVFGVRVAGHHFLFSYRCRARRGRFTCADRRCGRECRNCANAMITRPHSEPPYWTPSATEVSTRECVCLFRPTTLGKLSAIRSFWAVTKYKCYNDPSVTSLFENSQTDQLDIRWDNQEENPNLQTENPRKQNGALLSEPTNSSAIKSPFRRPNMKSSSLIRSFERSLNASHIP
jgi:hypothetical protein